MAEEFATHRRAAGQYGQPGVRGEGCKAQNGVVTPECAAALLPEMLAGDGERRVQAGGELLHSAEQGCGADRVGDGLDESGAGVGVEGGDEGADG